MMKNLLTVLFALSLIAVPVMAQRGGDNESGAVEIVDARGEVVGRFTEAHALVIGESEYANKEWRRLPGVKEDIQAVTKLFSEQSFNVEILENVSGSNLRNGIINFLDKYGYNPDARIVLYFAGHGATIDLGGRRMGYIVPVDAPPAGNDRLFLQTAIPMTQFDTWAKQYTSRHILFVFDSCFAGSVFRSQGSEPPAINRLISYPVRQFITSGDADEAVPDVSVFRKEFVHAIRSGAADLNKDGYVSGTELGLYLYDRVSNYTEGSQNPRVGKLNDTNLDKGDFVFFTGEPPVFPDPKPPQKTEEKPDTKIPEPEINSRNAAIAFTGDTPAARDKQTITSGLRLAMQTMNINLDLVENSGDEAGWGFNVIIYINTMPSGLLQAEVTVNFSRNGRVLWQTNPYYITETNETMIARRISERIRADQAFFEKIKEIVK
jgi:hypothetical protein